MNEVEMAFYEAGVKIDSNGLDQALMEQPENFRKVSKAYAMAFSRRDKLKDIIKRVRAEAHGRIRQESTEKLTETALSMKVEADPSVLAAIDNYHESCAEAAELESLKQSYDQRAYVLKDLSNLWQSGYFQSASARGNGQAEFSKSSSELEYERNKQRMAEARRANQPQTVQRPQITAEEE